MCKGLTEFNDWNEEAGWELTNEPTFKSHYNNNNKSKTEHINPMKNEFGDWTICLNLCFLFSNSVEGFNESISFWKTCTDHKHI